MILKSKLLILIPILTIFSNNALAELRHYPIGNSQVRLGIDHSKSVVTDFRVDGQRFSGRIIEPAIVDHMPSGARASAKVPLTIEASVSRKAVLSGAFQLVKRGAALGTRLSGWGTAAYFAYEAYQVVKSDLEFEGYKYDKEQEEFLKYYSNALCLNHNPPCLGVDSSVMRAISIGGKSREEAGQLLSMQVTPLFRSIFEKNIKPEYPDRYFSSCFFMYGAGVVCELNTGTRYLFNFENNGYSDTLTEEKFLKIATSSIDGNPTPFVEGTGKPEYQENIKVPAGTVVTIGPITPENGKPVQINITFGQDSNGNTTAEVATTQRPDLTPGGSEAPNTKPDPDPNPNPDGKPDKKPDDKPDSDDKPDKRPDDKPDDDSSDKRKEDKKEDKKEESKGLLCDFFPKILACDEQPEKEEPNLEIPQETIDLNFTPDNTFKEYGECPAPVTFQALGTEYKISLEPACNLAAMMRPFIIAMAWLVASFFVARVVRNNA